MLRRVWTVLLSAGIAPLMAHPLVAEAAPAPTLVEFYYGWVTPETGPDLQGYQDVVLGADSESSSYPNYSSVQQLVASYPSISFYGYVNLSDGSQPEPMATIAQEFAEWKALGVKGVFLDLAGSNYGVPRALRTWAVLQAHALGLSVALNAWAPSDAVGVGLAPGDVYVAEDWYMSSREPQVVYPNGTPAADLAALRKLTAQGVGVWAVTQESVPTPSVTPDMVSRDVQGLLQTLPVMSGIAIGGANYGADTNAIVPASEIQAALASAPAQGSAAPVRVDHGPGASPAKRMLPWFRAIMRG
ncbi:hypothetical protein [Alicyclobacillus sendaiensis]|uniref:hypothetical protein n=1 Tax=Alicyclobacillus sendaiensis TaxID=192387 RepID=UPI0026F44716|nr:hypothetical protein [Alicyclobacillus sendaiensis]